MGTVAGFNIIVKYKYGYTNTDTLSTTTSYALGASDTHAEQHNLSR